MRLLILLYIIIGSTAVYAADVNEALVQDLKARRTRVMEETAGRSVVILFSGTPKNFSNDVDYPFRQENNLYYLTGINQTGITLVLIPDNTEQREILFLPARDPSKETWTGHMLSHEEAMSISGIQHIRGADSFEPFLEKALGGKTLESSEVSDSGDYQPLTVSAEGDSIDIWMLIGNKALQKRLFEKEHTFANSLTERFSDIRLNDVSPVLQDVRLVKSDYEVQQLQKAIDITCEAHRKVMKSVQAGGYEYQLDGLIHNTYRQYGAQWGFPSIVGSGPNATTLHYEENTRQMHDGELVLLDIGAEVGHYSADVTRTIPVNGFFSDEQRTIYDLVFRAQEAAMKLVRPGATIGEVHNKARDVIKAGLKELGLITDTTGNQYRMWFMHGTSHFIGLAVHDVGGRNTVFRPGMVLTVEPGIYVREEALDHLEDTPKNQQLKNDIREAFERYKNIGVRIEDDVLVTENGYELLSGSAPRNIDSLMSEMK